MNPSPFLQKKEIETHLKRHPDLESFWKRLDPVILYRNKPSPTDPVYEIQMTTDLGDRLETFAWVWVDALEGRILQIHLE